MLTFITAAFIVFLTAKGTVRGWREADGSEKLRIECNDENWGRPMSNSGQKMAVDDHDDDEKKIFIAVLLYAANVTGAVRLHKIFQYLDGYKSEHNLQGFLHVGIDYAVFLTKPKPHDKFLVYELYETKNFDSSRKPRLLAISKIPVAYIKEQLSTFKTELYKAKYVDDNVVPGVRVKTLREWQIDRALTLHSKVAEELVLRTIVL